MVSKELNLVFEQVARCCAELNMEGRAIILGVNGLDLGVNAGFSKGLKTFLEAAGNEVAVFHLESCANSAVRAELAKAAGARPLSLDDVQRYLDEGIDFDNARTAIQELTGETGVLIVDGELLYTGALSDLFDLRLFLEVDASVARGRLGSVKPPVSELDFDTMLVPAFEHYLREYDPASVADLTIDCNDARKPKAIAAVG